MNRTLQIITILLISTLLAVPTLADGNAPSTIPHAFYGPIYNVDGSNTPGGLIVIASAKGNPIGTITTTLPGQYGTEYGGGDKLIVWDPFLNPGDEIIFYIDGVRALESAIFESGCVSNLTLNAEKELPKERPDRSTTRPVTTTDGQPVTIETDDVSVVLTTIGDFQSETLIFTLFTAAPDNQPIPSGNNAIGRFAEITSSIVNQNIQKVIIKVHYSDSDVIGTDENSIRVYWWNGGNSWVQLPGGVDTAKNVAWGETDHFSTFALLGIPGSKPSGGGGAGGGFNVVVTQTPLSTPIPGLEVLSTLDESERAVVIPSITKEPLTRADADISPGEPGTEARQDFPSITIIIVIGIAIVAAAGFLLLRRQ
ncbi:hypothetical protein [Methanocalculus sp.]|uniref:hypothetical protein n=1 Tax=Methanocalculus sp. TaxID=2004547 RepID=UPI00271EF5A3|nr:hypothetical protein [Methanocalculus sp.]MDO8842528.1 hypothetical protein [Methanocalculus sp.]